MRGAERGRLEAIRRFDADPAKRAAAARLIVEDLRAAPAGDAPAGPPAAEEGRLQALARYGGPEERAQARAALEAARAAAPGGAG